MPRWKQDPHRFIVHLLVCAVCAAIASPAGAAAPAGRTVELAREVAPLAFGAATTSNGSVVEWVARRPDGTTALKAAWIPWRGSVAGKAMTLAEGVNDLPPQTVAGDDGRIWVVYAEGNPTPPDSPYSPYCRDCSIRARILSAAGPVGDTPITLAVVDELLHQFQARAQPGGGLLLRWWHQGVVNDSINHESTRAFDSQGNPLADESELLGGGATKLAVADEGGALRVANSENSEQGIPYMQLFGALLDSEGAFLRGVELTPPVFYQIADYDVSRAAGGGYWLTWRENSGDEVQARRVTAGGDPGPILVAGANPTAAPLALAPTPDGGFLLCWTSRGRLFVQLHGANARPRGRPILLARGVTALHRLPLAVTATGRGVVAWWGWSPARDHSLALFLTRFTVSSRPTRGR